VRQSADRQSLIDMGETLKHCSKAVCTLPLRLSAAQPALDQMTR